MVCFCSAQAAPRLVLIGMVCASLFTAVTSPAQTPPLPGAGSSTKKQPAKRAISKSPNVKPGEITAIDAEKKTVTIKSATAVTASFALTEKSHFYKNRHEAKATDFKAGEAVVAHIRHSRSDGEAQIIELTDKVSWEWLDGLRHNVNTGKLTEIDDDEITVAIGSDASPVSFTVSDKTVWTRSGKPSTQSDFKVGDSVSIVPRSLPSGAIMASVISDTAQGAAQGKERKAATVHGVIQSLDTAMHTINLKTEANDLRILHYSEATEVHLSGKTLPLTALKPGQSVSARVRHDDDKDVAWSITLVRTGSVKTTKTPPGGRKMP